MDWGIVDLFSWLVDGTAIFDTSSMAQPLNSENANDYFNTLKNLFLFIELGYQNTRLLC
jgi:hypothetical protein